MLMTIFGKVHLVVGCLGLLIQWCSRTEGVFTLHHNPSTSLNQRVHHSIKVMAPRLAASQHQLIGDMIRSGTLEQADIAKAGGCTKRSV